MKEIAEVLERLRNLACNHKLVRLYGPADPKMVLRRFSRISGRPDEHLCSFYKHSNGASILDYCVLGCGNKRIGDIEPVRNLQYIHDWERHRSFIPFVATSAGECFGYLVASDSIRDQPVHPVSYCRDPESSGSPVLIASSVARFLEGLVADVEAQLARDPNSIAIDVPDWPLDLKHWHARDPELARFYE